MNWRQFQRYLKGKVFLIGLTFVDRDGKVIERYQTHGRVKRLTNDGIFKIEKDDHSLFQIPYDKDTIRLAKEGQYREKATGEIIDHADYIMTWEIVTDRTDDLEQVKQFGYIPKAG
ncbi:hypothetical protein D3C87_233730 [compost metagenome]